MKKLIAINAILALSALILVVYYFAVFQNISENVVRLHIIPNSNSEQDMEMKLSVRDEILDRMRSEIYRSTSRGEIIDSVDELEEIANRHLRERGAYYRATAEVEKTQIARKAYNSVTMPEGEYLAIRLVLGEGKGENWWCVAYPPLCFTEEVFGELSEEGRNALKKDIGAQGYRIIGSKIKYELKLTEVAEKIIKQIRRK